MISKTIRQAVCFVYLIAVILCVQMGAIAPALAQPAEAYGLVDAVNVYRQSVGLPRLEISSALMIAAQRHAEWMALNYTYSHTGEGGSRPQDRAQAAGFNGSVGENVAGGTSATPAEAVFFWDQSDAHRITMRQSLATHIGGGFAANSDQRLFVLLIGTTPGQAPQPTTLPLAGGTPAIGYTPPPGLVWTTDGQPRQGSDYNPAMPPGDQQSATTAGQYVSTAVAYVMPFDLIRLAEPRSDDSIVHVVEAGQTVWAIAARYRVDLQEVLAINHLSENAVLLPGDELIIRLGEGQAPPPAPTAPGAHQVQAGESLWYIAARYNRSVDEIRGWNHLPADAVIQPGDVLVVSPPTPIPTSTFLPTITSSPTLSISPFPLPTETLPSLTATELPATITPGLLPVAIAQITPPPLKEISQGTTSTQKDAVVGLLMVLGTIAVMIAFLTGAIILWFVRVQNRGRFQASNSRHEETS